MASIKKLERSRAVKRRRLLAALQQNAGFITFACKAANVSLRFYYQEYEQNEEFKDAVDEIQENWIDMAEHVVKKQIREGNGVVAMWYLSRKARHRGYGDRTDLSVEQNLVVFQEEKTYEALNPADASS